MKSIHKNQYIYNQNFDTELAHTKITLTYNKYNMSF